MKQSSLYVKQQHYCTILPIQTINFIHYKEMLPYYHSQYITLRSVNTEAQLISMSYIFIAIHSCQDIVSNALLPQNFKSTLLQCLLWRAVKALRQKRTIKIVTKTRDLISNKNTPIYLRRYLRATIYVSMFNKCIYPAILRQCI